MSTERHTDRKIVFFDIDGTLLDSGEKNVTPSAARAIREAQKNGHLMFINTGRCYGFITHEILDFGFDGMILGCGTQIVYQGKDIFCAPSKIKSSLRIRELARIYQLDIVFEEKECFYLDMDRLQTEKAKHHMKYAFDEGFQAVFSLGEEFPFDKFVTWNRDNSRLNEFIEAVSDEFDYIHRSDYFSEFVPKGYTKATGIEFILNYLRLSHDSAIAIGDSNNDLTMLRYVKHSVAMSNSYPKSLFEQVEFVTKDIKENGIEFALKHYGLI